MKTTIKTPDTVRRFARILKEQGYSKKNPFSPKKPFCLKQTIDMPGVLDFAYAEFVSFWPGDGVLYGKYREPRRDLLTEIKIVNSCCDYGDGNYVGSWWDTAMLKSLCEELEPKTVKTVKDFIPNFDPLYQAVCRFISDHQGKKGYIDTQGHDGRPHCDPIFSIEWNEDLNLDVSMRVHGVRVVDGDLQVVTEMPHSGCSARIVYRDEDFCSPDADWLSVCNGEGIQYVPTLLNIAEFIEPYC